MLDKVYIPKITIGIGAITIIGVTICAYKLVTILCRPMAKAEEIIYNNNFEQDPFAGLSQLIANLFPLKKEEGKS